ncbi:MAG: hypothetical protein J7L88_00990, partial [Thermoplasmata archaeon]|nr:hypothetical protein [Thermoplasmata archaeon]
VEVNLGTLAGVEEAPGELQDLDVKSLPRFGTPVEVKIAEITPKSNLVSVTGRVVQAAEKVVTVSGEEKEIQEGVLGDETGTIRFTNWGEVRFQVGKSYRIEGAYVKNWRGIPQLGIDDRCVVEEGGEVEVVEERGVRKTLSDLSLKGEQDVEVEGCILEVREGSGLIFRCPVCNRMLRDSTCMVHGTQQGYPDLRVKAVLDDGFGAAQVVLNREITSRILGMTPEEALEAAEGRGEILWIEEELRKRLEGKWYKMRGTSILDDFGPTLLPKEITPVEEDPVKEAERLLKEVEEVEL